MATITTILASDIIASSRVTLNTNFANLNTDKADINSSYADPAWITSLAGSKITGNIGGNAATATALATARTIAGVSFDGTANIAIPSSGLSDSSDIVRGASSVASGQVLYGTAAGVAGSEANLFWDAANDRLGVGTNAPAVSVDSSGVISAAGGAVQLGTSASTFKGAVVDNGRIRMANLVLQDSGGTVTLENNGAGGLRLMQNGNSRIAFEIAGSERARFAPSTGNLLLGTTTDDGTNRLQVAGQIGIIGASFGQINNAVGDLFITNNAAASALIVRVNGVEGMRVASTSRNVLIGGSTDGGFKIDIQNSGSSGTLRAYDQTPTTGATSVIVRAGAGQSSTNLTTWQNSGGTALAFVGADGGYRANGGFFSALDSAGSQTRAVYGSSLSLANNRVAAWSSTTDATGTLDLSLSRAGVNIGQIGDGGSNSNGLLYLKGVRPVGSTVANLPAAAGNAGMLATVTDATVTTIGTTVAGGGGNTVLVWSNGTNWRIYAN